MRILHTADWHLGKSLEGYSRLEEQEAFLSDFVEMVEEKDVDMVIIAGDVYDSSNPSARAEKLFYDTLKKISNGGKRITFVIAGNHDSPERLVAAGPLAMEHGIVMVGLPKTVVPLGQYGNHQVVASGEGFVELSINGENAVILTLPYPSERRLNEVLYLENEEEKHIAYGKRIKLFFDGLEDKYRADTINLVVSHLFAMGSVESGSERGIQLGGSYLVEGSCFPEKAQYIALGHIHKPQVVPGTNKRAWYPGAPLPYHKNEADGKGKKCYLIEVVAGKPFSMEEIPIKIYKPMEKWHVKSIAEAVEKCKENQGREAWVYLEIETDRYIKEEEIKEMRKYKADLIEIHPVLEGIEGEGTSLKPMAEKSFLELFQAFFMEKMGSEADEELVTLLLETIEGEEETHATTISENEGHQ